MYTREYLIALFFPAQRPYWFVSVLLRNPIPFPYPYFPNPIPFPPKNIETEVEMRFFHPFSSLRPTEPANASIIMLTATKQARDALYRRINESIMHLCMQAWRRFISGLTWICCCRSMDGMEGAESVRDLLKEAGLWLPELNNARDSDPVPVDCAQIAMYWAVTVIRYL